MKINCECNNEEAQIRWVRGNTQPLAIPLEQEIMTENEEIRTEPYYPSESDKVTVYLVGRFKRKAFTPEIDGNVLIIHEDGTLSTGSYHVEVLVEHQDGTRNRSLWCNQVVITESNDSVLEEWDEFKQQEPQARAAIFFFAKGDKGDPFTYEDFTQEQIEDLKKPAVDAAAELTDEVHALESEFTESENERVANENQRKSNEIARVNAETAREEQSASDHTTALADHTTSVGDHTTAQSDHTTSLSDHTQASSDHVTANGDHTRAESDHALAATDHTTATSDHQTAEADHALVTERIERADADHVQAAADHAAAESDHTTATSDHAQAATDHNAATSDHDTATSDHATASTDHATAQSDHTMATNDHDTATTDHQTAVSDHSIADGDHTLASADHTAAVADQTQAASDHTRAENDNATATSDHSRAVGDHITAAEDHTQAVSDHTTAAADHTTAESDHAAVEVYVDSLGVFDLSKHNAVGGVLATYADLSAALTALNALESKYKYGGMSVKFVHSVDNNYVQCRLIADEFTTDTTQWAIADEGVYVENPEYIYVRPDATGKILWAIKTDGSIYYGAGCPQQVKDYIEEKIAELSLDEYEDMVAFLSDYLGSDTTLKVMIDGINASISNLSNTKVDKEDGKSLIDSEYASTKSTIDNPEFIEVTKDSEDKVLAGRTPDGAAFENVGFSTPKISINGTTVNNIKDIEERVEIETDSEEKIIYFRDKNGKLHENVGIKTPSANIKEIETNSIKLSEEGIYNLNKDTDKVFTTVEDAVAKKVDGIIRVGENVVIGLKTLNSPYSAADIEANYKNILPAPKFPFIKQVSVHRLYDDAATPNMLYICSHSDSHIFYSICPTDLQRAVYEEGYYTKYNANYFYYADKHTPSDIHKVVLPTTVDGVSMNHRIKYVHEMSNGDCLLEIENGTPITGSGTWCHNNIYKIKNVFSGETIQENDVTLSIALDFYAEKISSFNNIVEYKAGHIIMAPYWGGRTGKVWITKDYGDTWDLIFCADFDNTHYIKPKAQHFGEQNAYGIYPPTELLNPEGQIDWSTPDNGNVHVHGIAYDRWYDRIWIVTGDGDWNTPHDVTGIWWTDDEGYTWKRIGGINDIKTQLIGVIPMDHCVLFPNDGFGDGFWRWARNGKEEIIKIENCYNYTGSYTALKVVGQRSIKTQNNFYLCAFAPNHYSEADKDYPGGIVATYNGFDFEKIYTDTFFNGTDDTVEIGWCCDITDCGDKLIISAAQGGYLELKY